MKQKLKSTENAFGLATVDKYKNIYLPILFFT